MSAPSEACGLCGGLGRVGDDIACWRCCPTDPAGDFLAGVSAGTEHARQEHVWREIDLAIRLEGALRQVEGLVGELERQGLRA